MPAPIKILYAFFCEYLRQETTGQVTAIGLWGSEWRIASSGPITVPALSFHAFVSNPDQVEVKGTATLQLPGLEQPMEMDLNIPVVNGLCGHNLNITIGNVPIAAPGKATVRIKINSEPPIDQEFDLLIKFVNPPEQTPST